MQRKEIIEKELSSKEHISRRKIVVDFEANGIDELIEKTRQLAGNLEKIQQIASSVSGKH